MADPEREGAAEKAYEARYGHRQDILHDPFDRGWNMGWAASEARYRELITEHRVAISLGFPARCVCGWEADYRQAEIDDDCGWAQWVGHTSARSALAALSENAQP